MRSVLEEVMEPQSREATEITEQVREEKGHEDRREEVPEDIQQESKYRECDQLLKKGTIEDSAKDERRSHSRLKNTVSKSRIAYRWSTDRDDERSTCPDECRQDFGKYLPRGGGIDFLSMEIIWRLYGQCRVPDGELTEPQRHDEEFLYLRFLDTTDILRDRKLSLRSRGIHHEWRGLSPTS